MHKYNGVIVIEGHVQGLSNVRALGESGIPVYVIDKSNCIARYSRYCKKFFKCPDFKSDKLISFLIQLSKNESLDGWLLLPSNDHAVHNISKNKEVLSERYKIITPEISVIEKIYNKEKLIKLAQTENVPAPNSWFPASYDDINNMEFSFPCLIKGKFGLDFYKKAGKKAFLSNNKDNLNEIISSLKNKVEVKDIFIQELIPYKENKTVSYTAFCDKGKINSHWVGIKLREHPVHFGTATYCKSVKIEQLEEYSEKLLKKINYTGVCEIEYLLDSNDSTYKLIEINARTWLWVELAKLCGINYALFAYNYVNDIENDYPEDYKIGKHWMHYITDIPFSMIGLLKSHYSIKNILKTYLSFPKPAVFRWKDILPFFAEILLIPLHILKR